MFPYVFRRFTENIAPNRLTVIIVSLAGGFSADKSDMSEIEHLRFIMTYDPKVSMPVSDIHTIPAIIPENAATTASTILYRQLTSSV